LSLRWTRRSLLSRARAARVGGFPDAAAVADVGAAIDFGEDRRQRARVRRAQPQAQQVPLALDFGPILVTRAGVQDRVVVEELDVTGLKIHVEPQFGISGQLAEHVECFKILRGETPRLGKALRRADMQPRIQHREVAAVFVEHRRLVERALALRHLAAAIGRERLVEPLQEIGAALSHHIVQGHRADDRRQPARLGAPQAQQRDDIAAIDVEFLALCGRVAAQQRVGRAEPLAEVVDMPEQMPLGVLRPRAAEIGADPPISRGGLGDRPIFDPHSAHQHKAAPVEHLAAQPVEHRPQSRQRKIRAADIGEVEAAGTHRRRRRIDLVELRRRQTVGPLLLALLHLRADPGRGAFDRLPPRLRPRRGQDIGFGHGHRNDPRCLGFHSITVVPLSFRGIRRSIPRR